jgi:hypothetical protein
MPRGFLLRFEELIQTSSSDVSDDVLPAVQCGTETVTKTSGEGGDPDPKSQSVRAIPLEETRGGSAKITPQAGTQTGTFVQAEGVDADPKSQSIRAIPRTARESNAAPQCGTQTGTAVRAEGADADPKLGGLRCVPRE